MGRKYDLYKYNLTYQKHEAWVVANGRTITKKQEDPREIFVVGEKLNFTVEFDPPLPTSHTSTSAEWSFSTFFFGRRANVYNTGPSTHEYDYDQTIDQSLNTHLWCIDPGDYKFPYVSGDLAFDNGQTAFFNYLGWFNVEAPLAYGSELVTYPEHDLWHADPMGGYILVTSETPSKNLISPMRG